MPEENAISEELKQELMEIQMVTSPIPDITKEQQIENIRKYYDDNYSMYFNGASFCKEEVIQFLSASEESFSDIKYHHHEFVRTKDTIIAQALSDWTITDASNVQTSFKDKYFCDVFVLVEGKWLVLYTIHTVQFIPDSDPQPAS